MKSEYKISLTLLVLGAAVIGGLYFKKQQKQEQVAMQDSSDKAIIIPSDTPSLPIAANYLNDLQKLYTQGKSVLPLADDELDSKGKIAQTIALKDRATF